MRMKSMRVCGLLLALAIVLNLVSAAVIPAVAADSSVGSVILSKSATLEDDGTYTIDLSGYVTGQATTSQVDNAVPLDVVLVLDASSSMLKFCNTPETYTTTDEIPNWGSQTKRYPSTATSTTNLWEAGMSRASKYYDGTQWVATNTETNIRGSVLIPVKPGDKIYCTSFRKADYTGGSENGIYVTYFKSNGEVHSTLQPAEVYQEYRDNWLEEGDDGRYITVPDGAYVMNIPVWNGDTAKEIYNRSLGEERYNPVSKLEFNAVRAKILQQQVQAFADSLAANGLKNNVDHRLAIVTFGGGSAGSIGGVTNQGVYEKHVGVNGLNNYKFTNTGVFVGGQFKNYWTADMATPDPMPYSYTPIFANDLDTTKTYYYLEPTKSVTDRTGEFKEVTYNVTDKAWLNADGTVIRPQGSPYQYNSYYQFYSRDVFTPGVPDYENAMVDVLVDGALNPQLQYAIDRYVARGTTHTEFGMAMADEILERVTPRTFVDEVSGQSVTSQQLVILFTDGNTNDPDKIDANGDPVAEDAEGTPTYQTIFYRGNRIKHKGAKIYTISVADKEEGAEMAQWMDQLSSNHSNVKTTSSGAAVSHSAAATIFDPSLAVTADSKYYYSIDQMAELEKIFSTITTNISTTETLVELDDKAVMRDFLMDGFKIPDDFSLENNIKVSIVPMNVNGTVDTSKSIRNVVYDAAIGSATTGDVTSGSFKYGSSIDLTVSFNKATGMVSVTGFNYAKYFVGEGNANRFMLAVQITGVEATNATPTDVLLATNTTQSGIAYTNTEGKEVLYPFEVPKTQLASKNYVVDYAKPMTISAGDWGTILGIASCERLNLNATNSLATNEITTEYGVFTNNGDNTYTFTPDNMQWDGTASFYVLRKLNADDVPEGVTTGVNQWLRVNVAPANNVYYEDDFEDITYTGTGWTTGTIDNSTENPEGGVGDDDGVHGWEGNLVDPFHSDGSAHMGVVSSGVKAEASFTFVGMGVDIYGYTDSTTGTVLATLQGTAADGTPVSKIQIVDTQSVSGDYYQIPAVSFMDLEYGTYTVTLRVTTSAANRFTYYLDGVRVYKPLQDDSPYSVAEQNAESSEIRDLLSKQVSDAKTGGAVFIDKTESGELGVAKDYDQTEYGTYGPKNEVYLGKSQSITFKVDTSNSDAYYYVGLKAPEGTAATVVKVSNGTNTTKEITINHSTDLYYPVVPDSNGYVSIENTGDGLLSMTKLRIAGASADAQVATVSETEALEALDTFSIRPVQSTLPAPEVQTPVITLDSPTLLLEDSIKLNINYTVDQTADIVEMGLMTWTKAPDKVDFATADAVFPGYEFDHDKSLYSVTTPGIPAQNLGDIIYFCVYAQMEDNSYVYSKQVQYSPATYAYNQLNGNADAASKALYVAILNYGAAAQSYLGYKTDALINADLTDDMMALVESYHADMVHAVAMPSATKQGALVANGGFADKKPTIALDDAFSIYYYFTSMAEVSGEMNFYYWNADDFNAADVLSLDNATGSAVMTNEKGTYGAAIEGIAAKEINGALYACGVYTDVDGNTYSTGVLPYSLGFYCSNQAEGESDTAALAAAIAVYGYYAEAYFA